MKKMILMMTLLASASTYIYAEVAPSTAPAKSTPNNQGINLQPSAENQPAATPNEGCNCNKKAPAPMSPPNPNTNVRAPGPAAAPATGS